MVVTEWQSIGRIGLRIYSHAPFNMIIRKTMDSDGDDGSDRNDSDDGDVMVMVMVMILATTPAAVPFQISLGKKPMQVKI